MGRYLETQTCEKLQAACDSIRRACKVYEICQLYNLGLIARTDVVNRFKLIGVRANIDMEDLS